MNIALPDALRAFVAQRVESGEYGNPGEHVREQIRKDQREQRVQRLRALVEDGLASGPATADTGGQELDIDRLRVAWWTSRHLTFANGSYWSEIPVRGRGRREPLDLTIAERLVPGAPASPSRPISHIRNF